MAKRITWTEKAEKSKNAILDYWEWRNGNKTYSKKLFRDFNADIERLALTPHIGRKVEDDDNIYFIIVNEYKIFYSPENSSIEILLIWDTRRNPDDLKL